MSYARYNNVRFKSKEKMSINNKISTWIKNTVFINEMILAYEFKDVHYLVT